MRSSLLNLGLILLTLISQGCTTYRLDYDIKVHVKDSVKKSKAGNYQLKFSQEVQPLGTAIICSLTFHYFGGACWAFNYLPYQEDSHLIERKILSILDSEFGHEHYEIWSAELAKKEAFFLRFSSKQTWSLYSDANFYE